MTIFYPRQSTLTGFICWRDVYYLQNHYVTFVLEWLGLWVMLVDKLTLVSVWSHDLRNTQWKAANTVWRKATYSTSQGSSENFSLEEKTVWTQGLKSGGKKDGCDVGPDLTSGIYSRESSLSSHKTLRYEDSRNWVRGLLQSWFQGMI